MYLDSVTLEPKVTRSYCTSRKNGLFAGTNTQISDSGQTTESQSAVTFQCHSAVKYNDAVNLDETNSDDTAEHTVNIGEDNGGNVTDMEG